MGEDPDLEWLVRWRDGDAKAGERLVTRYYGPIRRFFTNSVSDDAFQDLTNETFKRLMAARAGFDGSTSVRTFLFRLARNVLYDHLRKHYRRDARGFDPMTHSVADVEAATPSRAVAELDQHRRLVEQLRALPVDTKLLLELYYWQGCTAEELAAIYEVKPATIRTRIHAAREQLKRGLAAAPGAAGPRSGDQPSAAPEGDAPDDALARDLRAVGTLLVAGPSAL